MTLQSVFICPSVQAWSKLRQSSLKSVQSLPELWHQLVDVIGKTMTFGKDKREVVIGHCTIQAANIKKYGLEACSWHIFLSQLLLSKNLFNKGFTM